MIRIGHAAFPILLALAGGSLAQSSTAPAPPAPAEKLTDVATKARAARLKGDVPTWLDYGQRALALTPGNPDILISVARAYAASGNRDRAIALLHEAVARGAGFDPGRVTEFKALSGDPRLEIVAARARANARAIARSTSFATLPSEAEGIAYDPLNSRFFVGSDGHLLAVDMQGKVSTFAKDGGLRQLLGIKIDPARRRLWVVSGRYPDQPPGAPDVPADAGTGEVRSYDLDSAALLARYELDERPVLHGLNDIAIAADGTLFVTDSVASTVYVLRPGASALAPLLTDARMSFPNGIVLSEDGKRLYVAHAEGISLLDPATGARTQLPLPADAAVNGIDGLALYKGDLIGVQGSPYLQRLVRIALDPSGTAIRRVTTLNSRSPAAYGQTTAAVAGDHVYMVGGFPAVDPHGEANPAEPAPQIWRVPLNEAG